MALDGLVLSSIVYTMHLSLHGGRIDKIFQPDRHTIIIIVRQPGANIRMLASSDAQQARIQLTHIQQENPDTPPAFCMLLRKYLENGRIVAVKQQNLDRIVHLTIENWDEEGGISSRTLICEIMGKHSNMILVNKDGLILDALHRIPGTINRYREILPGRRYIEPPGQEKSDPLQTDNDAFQHILLTANPQQKLSNILVQSFMGMGPGTAREIMIRAGINAGALAGSITDETQLALAYHFMEIMQDISHHRYQPTIVTPLNEAGVIDFACYNILQYPDTNRIHFATMSEAMDIFYKSERIKSAPGKDELIKHIRTEKNRAERKLQIQTEELAQAHRSDMLKMMGDLLTANLGLLQKGQKEISVLNYYDPDLQNITIPLEPKLKPVENAQHYYHRYAKAKRSVDILERQITETTMEITYLDGILVQLDDAATKADMNEIRTELSEQGYLPPIAPSTKKYKGKPPVPTYKPLRFISPDGWDIYVGKNNKQNDYVTFKLARSSDLWLHTKDIPGSHVIVRMQEPDIPPATLQTAAHLATYFSKSRASSNVPVDYTLRKSVRKPSGAKPGFVIYEQQRTLYVTPDEATVTLANHPLP
jgi:predicted ribosome quality control (RQC) complex YloA/Tae2 family protein